MKKGQIMYQGNSSSATDYFASLGHPCPPNFNPADHLIDVLSEGNSASFDSVKVAESSESVLIMEELVVT
jgi:hypothetical protein